MKTFKLFLKLSLFVLVITVVIISIVRSSISVCEKLELEFQYSGTQVPIDSSYIDSILRLKGGHFYGIKAKEIDQEKIQAILTEDIYIKEVTGNYITGGTFHLELVIARPNIAILDGRTVRLYIDEDGDFLPYNPKFERPQFSVQGHIPIYSHKDTAQKALSIRDELHLLSQLIIEDSLNNGFYERINRGRRGEYTLTSKTKSQRMQVGSLNNFQQKRVSLTHFNKHILPKYNSPIAELDLRFEKRIIVKTKRTRS